jgi:hypothetical protein
VINLLDVSIDRDEVCCIDDNEVSKDEKCINDVCKLDVCDTFSLQLKCNH